MSEHIMSEKWWKVSKEEEYRRNKDLKEADVETIRDWMKSQPHLPQLNDNQIIMFLNACNYRLETTKEIIELNYSMRTKYTEFFAQRDLSIKTLQYPLDNVNVVIMPERQNNNIVVLLSMNEPEISIYIFFEYVKFVYMFLDLTHLEFGAINGYIYIFDFKNFTLSHVFHTPFMLMISAIKFMQEASTCVIRGIHIINGGVVFDKLFILSKPFLKAETRDMIKIHSNYDSLIQDLGSNVVPENYGGDAETVSELKEKTVAMLHSYTDWFKEEEKQRVDETKRIPSKSSGIFGYFKKITG